MPLGTIHLPRGKHTPGPHETPLQPLAVTGAICLDVAQPSLFQDYLLVDSSSPEESDSALGMSRSPALILNPSSVPPPYSLAQTQLHLAQ